MSTSRPTFRTTEKIGKVVYLIMTTINSVVSIRVAKQRPPQLVAEQVLRQGDCSVRAGHTDRTDRTDHA